MYLAGRAQRPVHVDELLSTPPGMASPRCRCGLHLQWPSSKVAHSSVYRDHNDFDEARRTFCSLGNTLFLIVVLSQ
jgi:hypothetical protein